MAAYRQDTPPRTRSSPTIRDQPPITISHPHPIPALLDSSRTPGGIATEHITWGTRLTLTRSSASLKLMTFQIAFKYCKVPTNDTHRERPRDGERERGERDEGMRTRDKQVSAGTQSYSPGSDDDEGAEMDNEAWRDNGARLTSGLTFLYCK